MDNKDLILLLDEADVGLERFQVYFDDDNWEALARYRDDMMDLINCQAMIIEILMKERKGKGRSL